MSQSKELKVISKSKDLVYMVYKIKDQLPDSEKFILIPQILRSAISVPSNIAEGSQKSTKDFSRFIDISRGSLKELEIQLEIIEKVYGLDINPIIDLINEIGRMTYGLKLKLRSQYSKSD